jgi:acyl carrier protein
MGTDKVFDEIRRIIAEVAEIDESEIRGESKFDDDLGVDSVKALEIVVEIERKFNITFDESRLADIIKEIRTVNDAIDLTRQLLQEATAP